MALTGELSDLSLAELIEFFCNQRKTGCLKVIYPIGAGYFYLKSGAVIHARFGDLKGIEAVYYALTQNNASFTFSSGVEAPEHSIKQPWTSVVLEGLRRIDEGVVSPQPSPASLAEMMKAAQPPVAQAVSPKQPVKVEKSAKNATATEDVKAFGVLLSSSENDSFAPRRWNPAIIVAAVILLIAVVGIPWAMYSRRKAARSADEVSATTAPAPTPSADAPVMETPLETSGQGQQPSADVDAAELLRRQREARARERAKAEQDAKSDGAAKTAAASSPNTSAPASKKSATVQVTYDENGRVTAASGGDPTALRIARQKRFPPGKPGSATVTIPIN